jgi:hypothetical protein
MPETPAPPLPGAVPPLPPRDRNVPPAPPPGQTAPDPTAQLFDVAPAPRMRWPPTRWLATSIVPSIWKASVATSTSARCPTADSVAPASTVIRVDEITHQLGLAGVKLVHRESRSVSICRDASNTSASTGSVDRHSWTSPPPKHGLASIGMLESTSSVPASGLAVLTDPHAFNRITNHRARMRADYAIADADEPVRR